MTFTEELDVLIRVSFIAPDPLVAALLIPGIAARLHAKVVPGMPLAGV